ncbi:TIR domain-containing protein [Actinoplanes sp. NPDC049668]
MAHDGGRPARTFISYAHDNPEHRSLVREFWFFLRKSGLDAWSDFESAERRLEWPRTMESELARAEFILIIASPEYRRRAAADRPPGEIVGRGVEYESAFIRDRIYHDRHRWFARVLPVVLPGGSTDDLPEFLLPRTSTVYRVTDFSVAGAKGLLRVLTDQPSEIAPPIGEPPFLAPLPAPGDQPSEIAPPIGKPPFPPPLPAPGDQRARLADDLVAQLRELPAMETAQTKAHFHAMIAGRLPVAPVASGDQDTDRFLRHLVTGLTEVPNGLWTLSGTVHFLHPDQPVDVEVRRLVEAFLRGP